MTVADPQARDWPTPKSVAKIVVETYAGASVGYLEGGEAVEIRHDGPAVVTIQGLHRNRSESDLPKEGSQIREVFDALSEGPMTSREIAVKTGFDNKTVQNNCSRLKDRGLIEVTGVREVSGSVPPVNVWRQVRPDAEAEKSTWADDGSAPNQDDRQADPDLSIHDRELLAGLKWFTEGLGHRPDTVEMRERGPHSPNTYYKKWPDLAWSEIVEMALKQPS